MSTTRNYHEMANNERYARDGVFLPKLGHVRHLVESGALVYTCLDFETTDKDWKTAEITVASLTTIDIGYNLISDDLFEVRVPDRVGFSPEALLITRFMASELRKGDRLSPQHAVAQIYESVQEAPRRLWNMLGGWRDDLGDRLWKDYVDERYISIQGKNGSEKEVLVRHYPALDEENNVVKSIRVHEPQDGKEFMDMSYRVEGKEAFDYEDDDGKWKIRALDKYNIGFRNTFFDNRLMAAALFRANFPHKQIYAMNKKALGNHAADVFTIAMASHFFGKDGSKPRLGTLRDPETSRERMSAKLDLLMEENQRRGDRDVSMPEGVRVYDGTLHNLKRGHNAPDYDNAKSIGLHRYLRENDAELVAHIERCSHVDYFRRFMTFDDENGIPTTHPIRFGIISANDDRIYRAVPLITLGSDDQHGKFNKIWAMRADVDYENETFEGKKIGEMSKDELAALMRVQRGQPDAIFHEVHLKRHRGVVDIDTGLRAGHCAGLSKETMRRRRNHMVDYLDQYDRPFLSKALDAFGMQYPFTPPADDISQPYAEEEIWTAMGDVKYAYVKMHDGAVIKLPNLIREMAQDKFKFMNDKVGDCLRELLRPHKLEWQPTPENALAYAVLRAKQQKKLDQYQSSLSHVDHVSLPAADYPYAPSEVLSKKNPPELSVEDVYATMIQDRLYLMDKLSETTRAYEVQQLIRSEVTNKSHWQTIPFEALAEIPESRLLGLRDEGRLRIRFEQNPNKPAFRFAIRHFMENGMEELLSRAQRKFYMAETSAYVQGPAYIADPEQHRIMSVPKITLSTDKIQQNIRLGKNFFSASREGETGAYDRFVNDNLAESILDNVIRDTERRRKNYPLTGKRKMEFGINPHTDEPMPNVKFSVSSDAVKVTIPDSHADSAARHSRFGTMCFIIPDVAGIKDAKQIVLQGEKTKRLFYAADAILHPLPPRGRGEFDRFYQDIDHAYAANGLETPESGYVLSCSELAPVLRLNKRMYPSLRIEQRKLIATRDPQLGNLQTDDVLTGFIVRKYDLKFKNGQRVLLRGVDDKGEETGWEAVARIASKPVEMTLKEMNTAMGDAARYAQMDAMAAKCGFGTADDLKAHMISEFTRFDEDVNNPQNMLLYLEIEPVKKIAYWTHKQPRAAYEIFGKTEPKIKHQKSKLADKQPVLNIT